MRIIHFPDTEKTQISAGETFYGVHWQENRVLHAGFQNAVSAMPAPATALHQNRLPQSHEPSLRLSVSVVICTRDRPEHLQKCLHSFAEQSRMPDEVIVVDNASVDARTREVTSAAGMTYIREDRPGLDIARNTGAQAAKSDIIVYTDDDTVLHRDWLENIVNAFHDEGVDAVTGLVLPLRLDTLAQQIFEAHWSFGRGFEIIDFTPREFAASKAAGFEAWNVGAGANMAFRKRVFENCGYFDESLDVGASGCSGDSEFWYRIVGMGGTCRYDPSCIVFHDHRETEAGLQKQLRAYMCGHVTALRVQAQRFPNQGNLKRLYWHLPVWFAGRVWHRIRYGRVTERWFLADEIRGYLKGLIYPLGPKRKRMQ
ncbi:MAG: glycosyltransferase [Hyphomonadaceae bacterium]|nr:glycosyltransferase [Hyphomonadaceae bacterium]